MESAWAPQGVLAPNDLEALVDLSTTCWSMVDEHVLVP
jgi:hypothetical protein